MPISTRQTQPRSTLSPAGDTGLKGLARMHAVAAAALLCTGLLQATDAQALALGRMTVKSPLGEPLRAEVEVLEISKEEADSLKVGLAPIEAFRAAGMDLNAALAGIQIALQRRPDGRAYLTLIGNRPVGEPFMDMILEANWASGRIVRDYTLLFDPPNLRPAVPAPLAAAVAPTAPAAPAASPAPVSRPAPVAATAPAAAPTTAARAPAPAAAPVQAPVPAPTRERSGRISSGPRQIGRHSGTHRRRQHACQRVAGPDAGRHVAQQSQGVHRRQRQPCQSGRRSRPAQPGCRPQWMHRKHARSFQPKAGTSTNSVVVWLDRYPKPLLRPPTGKPPARCKPKFKSRNLLQSRKTS